MSYEPVGVVIVGTGLIARFHAQAVNASEKLRLVAVVNPTEGHGDAFAAEFGVPLIRDYDEAISREDVGMVLVALAYPLYNRVLKKQREKIAPEILQLSEELLK